ncbi:MAG: GTP 3',8-cyclase MoaA [Salinisphaeraceae bacterium]|jgi:cyclic pyranopterin phosphate synthase|nr:GTP 3',8-cyclase MoaA [Salinisphaeraceae bacterium]
MSLTSDNHRAAASDSTPLDRFGRGLRDLRISLTDRCNFRCGYCMPRHLFGASHAFLPRRELLSFEEIERLAGLFARLGVRKLRLTGGEPLLRRDLPVLVKRLAGLPGIEDISLTTNGALLDTAYARALAGAGLRRITVSLDALDDDLFRQINDVGFPVATVLAAIDHAAQAGLTPVKVNVVLRKGVNESQILPLAEYFRGTGVVLRFIEYMDVGGAADWQRPAVVTADQIIERIGQRWPLEPLPASQPGETARRFRYADGQGEVGVIASVSQPFCGGCTRARLSAIGELYTCLFASRGMDLREPLRAGASDDALLALISGRWVSRDDRYSELRGRVRRGDDAQPVNMSYIGG